MKPMRHNHMSASALQIECYGHACHAAVRLAFTLLIMGLHAAPVNLGGAAGNLGCHLIQRV
jgi:hypothetical protein